MFRYPEEQYRLDFDSADPAKATRCTIVSALDRLVLTQESPPPLDAVTVDPNLHLTVYGDCVIVRGPLSLPGKDVLISARVIGSEPDAKNAGAQIDVSAKAPAAPPTAKPQLPQAAQGRKGYVAAFRDNRWPGGNGDPGKGGDPGSAGVGGLHGGTIEIHTESFLSGSSIELFADGGGGGTGQTSQAGQDGGRGGDGDKSGMNFAIPGGSGGRGGPGGMGTTGGTGGAGGTVRVTAITPTTQVTLRVRAVGGVGGNGGQGGKGGKGGAAGPGRNDDYKHFHYPNGGDGGDGGRGGASGSGGAGGIVEFTPFLNPAYVLTGGGPGKAGLHGNGGDGGEGLDPYYGSHSGTPGVKPSGTGDATGQSGSTGTASPYPATGTLLPVHLQTQPASQLVFDGYSILATFSAASQRSMLLQKAKLLYSTADASSRTSDYAQVATLLVWLQKTTLPFSGATRPLGFSEHDSSILAAIYWQATALASQLALKRDFSGHLPTYVPQGSYTFYRNQLTSMLGSEGTFCVIEKAYVSFFDELQKTKGTFVELGRAQQLADSQGVSLKTKHQDALDSTNAVVSAITGDNSAVEAQYDTMIHAIRWAESQLGQLAMMAKELSMIAVLPGLADGDSTKKIAGQVTDALKNGITGVAGVASFPTFALVKQVDVLGANVATLEEGYTVGQGVITESDPNAYKLLAKQADFDAAVKPYLGMSPVQAAVDAVHEYSRLVQQRNADIMKFNANVVQLASLQAQIDQNDAQSAQVASLRTQASNPVLAPLTTFLARVYQDARSQVIMTLYMAARSFAFWSLKSDYSAFTTFVGLTDPSGINAQTLNAASQHILSDLSRVIETFGTNVQEFPPSEPEAPSQGLLLKLTAKEHPALFAVFKTRNVDGVHELAFTLPAALRNTPEANSPFYSKTNVRLRKARPWVTGATVAANPAGKSVLTVEIIHGGDEDIVDPNNKVSHFSHEPIVKNFQFDTKTRVISQDADFDQPGHETHYAAPGPFTKWKVRIDPDYNTGLDMSGLESLTIEFCGTNYAFA